MKQMTNEMMLAANGGKKKHIYTYYKCTVCGEPLGAKFAIQMHCKSKHGIKDVYRVVNFEYYL